MKVVADTNIFLAVVLNEPERREIVSSTVGRELAAPKILPFEIGNALSALVKRNRLTPEEALTAYRETMNIPVELRDIEISKALEIACRNKIYAYDAYFIECARALRSPLLSLDHGLKETAVGLGIRIMEVSS